MFLVILILVLLGAAVQLLRAGPRTSERAGRLLLVWVLAGYCGIPMVLVSVVNLAHPDFAAGVLGFPTGNPFQTFVGWAYLGMSLIATLGLHYRGSYLVGPSIVWAVFFAGATAIHLSELDDGGALTHGGLLGILATHGLISVLLVTGMLMSGVLRRGS